MEVERDDAERGDEAEQGEDGVTLLQRHEPLEPEDGAKGRREAEPARGDREEHVGRDEQAPLERRLRPEDLVARRQAEERAPGAERHEEREHAEPELERAGLAVDLLAQGLPGRPRGVAHRATGDGLDGLGHHPTSPSMPT